MGASTAGSGRSLLEAARQVGALTWFERRMFEVLSGWATDPSDPEVAVAFAEQARHRAWHADLWFARLPELRELDAPSQVVPAGPDIVAFCDHIEELRPPEECLAVLNRVVLPHQVAVLDLLASSCRPASDRSLARTVELVRRDLHEHWERSAVLLGDRMARRGDSSDAAVGPVTEAQAAAEKLLLAGGGVLGSSSSR